MKLKIINLTISFTITALLTISVISCVEKQKSTEIVEKDTAGNVVADYDLKAKNSEIVADVKSTDSEKEAFKNRFQNESKEVDNKLENLKLKVNKMGKETKHVAYRTIDSLKSEKRSFNLERNEHDVEVRWGKFRDKVNAAVDSLNQKI